MSAAVSLTSLTIRPATLADAPRLAPLSAQLGYPSTSEQTAVRLSSILADPDHVVFVAQQRDGKLLGWVDVFVLRSLAADPRAEIAGLVVDEFSRSQGVGAFLMARTEDWARGRGCAAVSLRSNVIRDRAHSFYERLGYQLVKTQKSYRKAI